MEKSYGSIRSMSVIYFMHINFVKAAETKNAFAVEILFKVFVFIFVLVKGKCILYLYLNTFPCI